NALTDLGDGLHFYREISKKAGSYLKDTGYLAFEIGYKQAKDVSKILEDNNFAILSVVKDYGGNDRVVLAKKAIKADNFEEIEEEENVDLS
ncbi:MAG: SAM-dependent methyltransferase, partial [Fusobacterium sp.]|nr:SAM-dependent methyltransferase [Fusobacterium sp.]